MTDELALLSATETAALIRRKDASPVDVVEAYLRRIERLDPTLHSSISVLAEEAVRRARTVERDVMEGRELGPLAGVPIGVKDQIWTKGTRTTSGSRVYADFVPDVDASVVERLSRAGGIVLAKHNMSELALGGTERPRWGVPANPWATNRSAGESSGGSGTAVAADLCAAALAEDTGGSARVPAAFCGVVGLRPTYGRVSRFGMTPVCWFADTAAPITKTVADAALLLRAIAGRDARDPTSSRRPVLDYLAGLDRGVRGRRIGVLRELHDSPLVDVQIRRLVDDALATFERLGAELREVSIPLAVMAGALMVAIFDSHAASVHAELLRTRADELDRATRTRLQSAALLPQELYHRAMKARVLLRRQVLEALGTVDVLASATSPFAAPERGAHEARFATADDVSSRFFLLRSYVAGPALAAIPALSLPCGFTSEGLPTAIQLVAGPFEEEVLLQTAYAYERATNWRARRPL